ncbi:MAG: DUF5103 domain-containing protein [Bacteroidales bacterium]|nr:DUF5103 domain-containing protein [Bacteroidales bacterium]
MKLFTIILCGSVLFSLQARGQAIREKVLAPQIKTVQMHKKGEPLSPPLITLNSGEQVTLRFDDLKGGTTTYSYQLIHCNASWEPSNLFTSDYISGQQNGEIYQHESSFNTLISYTHYRLNIPNERMRPTESGNYILHVYKNYSPSDTLLTRRFRISESKVRIRAEVDRINRMSREKPNQELNLTLQARGFDIQDPYNNLTLSIQQNYHRERILENLNPSSISGNTLSWQMNPKLTFMGGNEFHHFNSKNTDFAAEHIQKIRFTRNNYHFQLKDDKDRTFQSYQVKKDVNGRYRIDRDKVDDPNLEADYVYVYFTLKGVPFEPEGHYYVAGNFNNWQYNEKNRLRYDGQSQTYQKRLFLKQGYYDYKYVFRSGNNTDPFRISGNHEQTENDYLICVYYRDHRKGYDRLLGHTLVNSATIDY